MRVFLTIPYALPTVTYLACFQAAPTLDTMAAMERLLGYCAKHPNATQVIHPSPMLLTVFSDASFLNRPLTQGQQ